MSGSQFGAGGGMPQLPPQVLQALMQMMAQRQGVQGGGQMPQGPMPAMPQGVPQGPMPAAPQGVPQGPMPQQGAGGGMQPPPAGSPYGPPMAPPGGGAGPMAPGQQAPVAGQMPMTVPQLAMKGRFGDTNVAHVAPGEIQVPPEIQTPQLLSILRAAFQQAGVSPNQFTAGSPVASRNPQTAAQEFSILGALLPVAGAALGTFVAPGIGTAAGGALGGAAGGLIDKQSPTGVALSAAGGGLGGYLGGSGGLSGLLGSGAAGTAAGAVPASTAANLATMAADNPSIGAAGATTAGAGAFGGTNAAVTPSILSAIKSGMYAGVGSSLGGSLAPSTASPLPPGFNTPLGPTNPNFNQLLGNGASSTPTFAGYNPYTSVTGPNPGYRFYQ